MAGTTGGKKKWILYIILTSCSDQGCWHPQGDQTMLDSPACPATAFAATHRQSFASFFLGPRELKNVGSAYTSAGHVLEIMICRILRKSEQK